MNTSYILHKIPITQGSSLLVEKGAMQAYTSNLTMSTNSQTSLMQAILRKAFGGEDFFMNQFSAYHGDGWVALEELTPGQICEHTLTKGESIILRKGSFTACTPNGG